MRNELAKYTANTGLVLISTANTNKDGSGTLGLLITGASKGTLIKNILVKANSDTSQGMVRIFFDNLTNKLLVAEIKIPPSKKGSTFKSLSIKKDLNFNLTAGKKIWVSTENADSFTVMAEGFDWIYT